MDGKTQDNPTPAPQPADGGNAVLRKFADRIGTFRNKMIGGPVFKHHRRPEKSAKGSTGPDIVQK